MDTIVAFILEGLALVIGIFVGAFTIGQCVVIVRCGIPTVVRLHNEEVINSYIPLRKYITSFIFLFLILTTLTTLVFVYFPGYKFPYLFGIALAFILANRGSYADTDTINDFFQYNAKYLVRQINDEDIEYFFSPKSKYIDSIKNNEVFARVLGDSFANIIFYSIVTIVICLVGKFFWWAGIMLFGVFALFIAVCLLQFLRTSVLQIIVFVGYLYEFLMGEKEGLKEQFFPTLSTLVSVIQMALQLYYVLYLYQVFF